MFAPTKKDTLFRNIKKTNQQSKFMANRNQRFLKDTFHSNPLKLQDCSLCFIDDSQQHQLKTFQDLQKGFKLKDEVHQLMSFRLKTQQDGDIKANECVQDEDALRMMNMICGGYVEDDFVSHLSYNDFQQKKEDFDILRDIYQSIQKKYKNQKMEESRLKFRSMLLMVYLQENISKMSRVRIQQIFSKNRIVW